MLKTERFRKREDQLSEAIKIETMKSIWKNYIRQNLRDQAIYDLHDNYDFHIHVEDRLSTAITSVLQGTYQPHKPIRLRSEKKNGIARHLVLLNPEDALILEALCEYLSPSIKKAQPSDNAYYSRNKQKPKSVLDVDETFGYPWWILWPEFQKKILEFAEEKEVLVVTDVANYYDTINFTQLRNLIASLDSFSEIYLDFLFFVLEKLVWRPDYLPYSGQGLPQINIDAPRLLAHSFLFEIDEFLKNKTNDHFVRWMDDIDFGCDSIEEGKFLLRNLDELLLSRGLHLNSGKTKILNSQEAFEHFNLRENRYLTIFDNGLKNFTTPNFKYINQKQKKLRKRFSDFIKKEEFIGQWSKVIKRYFTLFGKFNDSFLEDRAFEYLDKFPELRASIFRYLISIGWSLHREETIKSYILSSLDDDSFFNAIQVLLDWQPDSSIQYILRMRAFIQKLDNDNPMQFLGSLWLVGKFGNAKDIDELIVTKTHIWKSNQFLARQVACLWPRMKLSKTREQVKNIIRSFGLTEAGLVLENFELISSHQNTFDKKVRNYIIAPKKNGTYPLYKLFIAISVFSGNLPTSITEPIKEKLVQKIKCKISKYYIQSASSFGMTDKPMLNSLPILIEKEEPRIR